MDLVRAWALGFVASAATFLIVLGIPVFRAIPLLQLLVPFAGALVASAAHPAPHRDRPARHALAVLPPGMALAVLGAYAAGRSDADVPGSIIVQTLVLALLVVLLATGLMVWARRRVAADASRR